MRNYIRREFTVDAPLSDAWDHFGHVGNWPSWARHIRRAELEPPGMVTPESKAVLVLTNGIRSTYQMIQFNPLKNWKWAGPLLWLNIEYDHVFHERGEHSTRITFIVDADGFAASVVGGLFAAVYNRNLDKAIPLLVSEINAIGRGAENRNANRS